MSEPLRLVIEKRLDGVAALPDRQFVAMVRAAEADYPTLHGNRTWCDTIKREIGLRLLLK